MFRFRGLKLGIRHEFKDSSFELGWLAGEKRNSTSGYRFHGAR